MQHLGLAGAQRSQRGLNQSQTDRQTSRASVCPPPSRGSAVFLCPPREPLSICCHLMPASLHPGSSPLGCLLSGLVFHSLTRNHQAGSSFNPSLLLLSLSVIFSERARSGEEVSLAPRGLGVPFLPQRHHPRITQAGAQGSAEQTGDGLNLAVFAPACNPLIWLLECPYGLTRKLAKTVKSKTHEHHKLLSFSLLAYVSVEVTALGFSAPSCHLPL